MRRSRQEAAETRWHIVESAASEFRNNGIDGTGLAGLMAAAGLTHGGFYKHFDSKEQVVEEALTLAVESMIELLSESAKRASSASPGNRGLQTIISKYLSVDHRDDAAHGCPFAGLGCEIARSSDSVREAMTIGFLKMADLIADHLDGAPTAAARKEALWMFSTMVGAVTMARMVTDPEVSESILRETRKHLIRSS
jgi:TetR/AcrR family transcriptional regulator, transcriptional repressor for nem operon